MTAPTPAPEYGELIERLTLHEHREGYDGKDWEKIASEAGRAIRDLEAENAAYRAALVDMLAVLGEIPMPDCPAMTRGLAATAKARAALSGRGRG